MRKLLFFISGFLLYLWLVAKYRSIYKGGNEFCKIAQCEHDSLAKQSAASFLALIPEKAGADLNMFRPGGSPGFPGYRGAGGLDKAGNTSRAGGVKQV